MLTLAQYLNWLALISSIAFLAAGLGQRLHPELLAFPVIALSLAQVLTSRNKKFP